jgi:chemotaxis protein MotA
MFVVIGIVIVLVCCLGSYVAMGGKLGVLNQPLEFVIILGSGIGAFVAGNPMSIIKGSIAAMIAGLKGPKIKKAHYVELLSMMFDLFKLAKQKGMMALEPHVEKPESSDIFSKYPLIMADHHIEEFIRDYLRMLTLGTEKAHELEAVIDAELESHHKADHLYCSALQTFADALPALGIVAAVMGVIKTMGAMDQPPAVLGGLIGAALVGTFAGVLLAYGIFGPIAAAAKNSLEADSQVYNVIKAGILAYMQGYAPAVAIEMARKTVEAGERPSFYDLEAALGK